MSREFPSFESNKDLTDQELLDLLKTQSSENPEVFQFLQKWTEQEEKKVENTPLASIAFNRRRARIYAAAGYIDEALDALEGARAQAWNEHRDDLYNEIMSEMERIESEH